jgi:hypothetical protein
VLIKNQKHLLKQFEKVKSTFKVVGTEVRTKRLHAFLGAIPDADYFPENPPMQSEFDTFILDQRYKEGI